ncbi:MAG: hypothetical protein ACOCRX_06145, partial [Candidatus Woesearchaeota archaeon]
FFEWIDLLQGDVLNLFLNAESFGFVHGKDSKIFSFIENLTKVISDSEKISFSKPNDFIVKSESVLKIERKNLNKLESSSLSEFLGNKMQKNAHDEVYNLKELVLKTENRDLINDWKKLQESTNFHFMNKEWADDDELYHFLNPYGSPYDAFINFNNVLNDLILRSKELINN